MNTTPTQIRMSEADKQRTYQAALVAMNIINQRLQALNERRREFYSNYESYGGNFSVTFNMDFMKVSHKLITGYMQQRYANSRRREWQVSAASLKIAKETGASLQKVKELFLSLMNRYIQI